MKRYAIRRREDGFYYWYDNGESYEGLVDMVVKYDGQVASASTFDTPEDAIRCLEAEVSHGRNKEYWAGIYDIIVIEYTESVYKEGVLVVESKEIR